MTKNKSQASSDGKNKAKASSDALKHEVDQLADRIDAMQVYEEYVLPSGGLAISQYMTEASSSSSTTSGTATPSSHDTDAGGYFAQFEGFTPQVDAGFLNNFNKLRIHENWSKKESARRRSEGIEFEFAHLFGTDYHNVAKWQELCELVGVNSEGLTSITKCKKALGGRKVMVNLFDLVDHLKNGTPLKKFKSFWAFQRYTLKPGRCMNREIAKKNAFVRVLLRIVA